MNNSKNHFLLILIILFLGVFLILKTDNTIENFQQKNISITVIKTKQSISFTKILGTFLILGSLFLSFYSFKSISKKSKKNNFTPQEKRIYELLKLEKTNKEIASELNVSVSTIKTHVNNIYKKIGISSRKQLVENQKYKKG